MAGEGLWKIRFPARFWDWGAYPGLGAENRRRGCFWKKKSPIPDSPEEDFGTGAEMVGVSPLWSLPVLPKPQPLAWIGGMVEELTPL